MSETTRDASRDPRVFGTPEANTFAAYVFEKTSVAVEVDGRVLRTYSMPMRLWLKAADGSELRTLWYVNKGVVKLSVSFDDAEFDDVPADKPYPARVDMSRVGDSPKLEVHSANERIDVTVELKQKLTQEICTLTPRV